MRQLTLGAELVHRRPAKTEALGHLAHGQQLLGKLHEARGHRGDKRLLVWGGNGSIPCIGSVLASNDVDYLIVADTRCQTIRVRRGQFGTKGSQVQILSPRLFEGRGFPSDSGEPRPSLLFYLGVSQDSLDLALSPPLPNAVTT